ncbi:hypothetical protein [Mycobacterium tuberculosis]|uniref:hypothetical protein n=1 Tax=Mycobacterium tuberculosis TaxID=1773 RepID=UPI003F88A8D0
MRFRLASTRWRGLQLHFAADWKDVYLASWPIFVMAAVWIAISFGLEMLAAGPRNLTTSTSSVTAPPSPMNAVKRCGARAWPTTTANTTSIPPPSPPARGVATTQPYNVNFFCHRPPEPDERREAMWRQSLAHYYGRIGAHTHEGRVAETHQATETEDEVEAGGGERKDQDARGQAQVEVAPDQRRPHRRPHPRRPRGRNSPSHRNRG